MLKKWYTTVLLCTTFIKPVKAEKGIEREQALNLIQESKITYKNIASKIAILETGNFSSRKFKNHSNLFGFKKNSRNLHTSINNGYCVYSSVNQSIRDYELWEKSAIKKHKIHSRSQFLAFISRTYSKTNNYIKLLEKIKSPIPQTFKKDGVVVNILKPISYRNISFIELKAPTIPYYDLCLFTNQ